MTTVSHGVIRPIPSPHGPAPVAPGLAPHLDTFYKGLDFWRPLLDRSCRFCNQLDWDGGCKTDEAQQTFKLRADREDKGKRTAKASTRRRPHTPKTDPAVDATKANKGVPIAAVAHVAASVGAHRPEEEPAHCAAQTKLTDRCNRNSGYITWKTVWEYDFQQVTSTTSRHRATTPFRRGPGRLMPL